MVLWLVLRRYHQDGRVMFEPRVEFLGLRDGLGLSVAYVLVHHGQDSWDRRASPSGIKPNTDLLQERSSWGSDAFSVTALYDLVRLRND